MSTLTRLLWLSVRDPDGSECWLWLGARDKRGYGRMSFWEPGVGSRKQMAHRIAYETFRDETVPASWDVHHACGNRACINPAHLVAMYHKANCATGNRNNHHNGSFKKRTMSS